MAVKIGSNISSLQAQRRLGEATSSLSKTYERLASGQRINRAADDAAGLAISNALNAHAKIFTQGIRNLNDGLSYGGIAGGALKELKSILLRQRELATQSANGTYSDGQRRALEIELKELSYEWNRILDSTSFNGRKVFSAKEESLTLQAGVGIDSVLRAAFGSDEGAAQDDTIRISVAQDGTEGCGESDHKPSISADGRYAAFSSDASNLAAGDTAESFYDIFVKDLQTGEIRKVTSGSAGGAANNSSYAPVLSADGRYVAFSSNASNLIAGDTADGANDIFIKDLQTGEIRKVTSGSAGGAANGSSDASVLSADGRYVAFSSNASNLVAGDMADGVWDIFIKDLQTGEIRKVTSSSAGGAANSSSGSPALSADGRYVAFSSNASNLIAGDTADGFSDIFIKDLQTGEIRKVTSAAAGGAANSSSNGPVLSADGRYVAFQSSASNLVAGDTADGVNDIFIKDLQTGEISKVTSSSAGGAANASSAAPVLSADGRYVGFSSSASNLVAGDTTDGEFDVFIKDLQAGEIRKVTTSTTGGASNNDSFSPVLSADGRYLAFCSYASNLTAGDSGLWADNFVVGNPFAEWSTVSRNQWLSVATQEEALRAQESIDNYLSELNGVEGALGAIEARLQTAASNLHSMTENFRAAESRITDADIGEEAANLARTQIAQQAAEAVLAQANQAPALALALLG